MKLKSRLDRLDRIEAKMKPGADMPSSIEYRFYAPAPSGPDLVALLCRPLRGDGITVQLDRAPGEDEAAFRARFDAACAS